MKYNEKREHNLNDDVATQTSPGGAPPTDETILERLGGAQYFYW